MEVDTEIGNSNIGAIDLTPEQDGGVLKVIKRPGSCDEQPTAGNKVTVHYTGTLLDGTKFDSSRDRGDKFTFNLGKGEVIKAWDIGVASMKRGELCELTCKPYYAYGKQGSPPKIPPNSTLVFEIELFDWEAEDISPENDKSVIRQILTAGLEPDNPNEGARVKVKFQGKFNEVIFDEREVEYNLNEGDDELQLVPAIDIAVKKMNKGERCKINVKSKYGYGATGCEKFNIPSGADLIYEIELIEFEKTRESWEMNDQEKIEESIVIKAKGTEFFKAKQYKKAIIQYLKIEKFLDYHETKEEGSDEDRALIKNWNEVKCAGLLNLALCYNKTGEFTRAERYSNKVLKINPLNEKAMFRRGEAQFNQNDFDSAKVSFAGVLKVNKSNKTAHQMMQKCAAKIKDREQKEMAKYQGMFEKFAKKDADDEIRQKIEQKKERAKAKAEKKSAENGDAGGNAKQQTQTNGHSMQVTEEST